MARREDRKDKPSKQSKERPLSPSEKKEALIADIRKKFQLAFGHEDIPQRRR